MNNFWHGLWLGFGIGIFIGGIGVALFVYLCFDKLRIQKNNIVSGDQAGRDITIYDN